MAKDYREISLTYNAATTTIDTPTANESVSRLGASSVRRTLDLTEYHQFISTNTKRVFTYTYGKIDSDVFDFFNDAYTAFLAGASVVMTRELDSGSTEDITVHLELPQYDEDTITSSDGKIYNNFSIRISEV